MAAAQFPVPPAFVVMTGAYRRFVDANGLGNRMREIATALDASVLQEADRASTQIRALFAGCPMPRDLAAEIAAAYRDLGHGTDVRVAVRSSATAEDLEETSFAGQQDTYLNVRGETSVINAIRSCWGSLWNSRAIMYRARQKIPMDGLALAVVVQRMVEADAAGVMFTANPVTGARDEIVINAAWGLGEAIVGGLVTPDTIVADKANGKVRSLKVSDKRVMTVMTGGGTGQREIDDSRRNARVLGDADVARLAELGRRVERYYGKPQDIEWALAGGVLSLLQTRPVTALPDDPAAIARLREDEIARLRDLAAGRRRVWILHNLAETLPAPTPLTWDIVREFMSANGGFGRLYRDLGYRPGREVCENGFLELICGRVYADPARAADLFWEGMPLTYDPAEVAANPKLLDSAPTRFDAQQVGGRLLLRLPGLLHAMWRCARITRAARSEAVDRFERRILPPFLDWVQARRREDLTTRSTADLLEALEARIDRVMDDFGCESLKPGLFGGMAEAALQARLGALMGREQGMKLLLELTEGLEGDTTVEQSQWLWDVAAGSRTRQEFLDRFGHRAVEEMELARPRWREDDSYVRKIIGACRPGASAPPSELHSRNAKRRQAAEARLPRILAEWGGGSFLEEIRRDLRDAQTLLPYRESGKSYLMMGYETIRHVIVELGRRWRIGDNVFFLKRTELASFEARPDAAMARIEERRQRWQAARRLDVAEVVDSDDLASLGVASQYAAASELRGEPIAPGVSTGTAVLVRDPSEAVGLCTDYVLVCRSTDPAWTALFVHARGLVVEQGGVLSHGAIVARDFGIPAVVCHGAMRRIPDGALVRVDGTRGLIAIVGEPSNKGGPA